VYSFDPYLIRQHVREACGGAVQLEKSSIAKDVRDFLPIMREIIKGQNRPVVKTRRSLFSLNGVFDGREGLQVISVSASLLDMRLSNWFETLQILEERKRKRLEASKQKEKAKARKIRKRKRKLMQRPCENT
jgi:hypothetical protein